MSYNWRPTEDDDVIFRKCIRCGKPSRQGLCQTCGAATLYKLGREPCTHENCFNGRCGQNLMCKEHR